MVVGREWLKIVMVGRGFDLCWSIVVQNGDMVVVSGCSDQLWSMVVQNIGSN